MRAEHGPLLLSIQGRLGAVERVPQLAPRQRRVAVRDRRDGEPGQGLGEELEGARLLHGDRKRDPFPALAEALERREGAQGPAARRPRRCPPYWPPPSRSPASTAPPPGHVAIPGLDLVDDTRPGMPRFGYAYDDRNAAPDAPPEFIRDADDI